MQICSPPARPPPLLPSAAASRLPLTAPLIRRATKVPGAPQRPPSDSWRPASVSPRWAQRRSETKTGAGPTRPRTDRLPMGDGAYADRNKWRTDGIMPISRGVRFGLKTLADPDLRFGGGATHAGAKPRVPPNPVFSSDLGHLFFVTALTR